MSATTVTTTRRVVQERYGSADVLELRDEPLDGPGPGQALVRIEAATLNPLDWHLMTGTPYLVRLLHGVRRPKRRIPGNDGAGVVEAVGTDVDAVAPGDRVVVVGGGCFAERAVLPADRLVPVPEGVELVSAAGLPVAGVTALQGLVDVAEVQAGQTVVVNGASGGVGHFAVQIAHHLGARVIGVCSGRNVELVRSLGADEVVDHTTTRLADVVADADVVLDMVGHPPAEVRQVLAPDGRWVIVGMPKDGRIAGPMIWVAKAKLAFLRAPQTATSFTASETSARVRDLLDLVAAGHLRTVVERTYGLSEIAAAVSHLETGRADGKIAIDPTR